jgi:hypothetical protein
MTPVLRDVGLDRGQLGDLMASRVADAVPWAQGVRAPTTRVRDEVDDRLHVLEGHEWAVMPRVARLPAGVAPTLDTPATDTGLSREAVGGGGLRRRRRVLLPQCELPFEIGDPFRLLRQLLAKLFVLPLQPFDLVRVAMIRVARDFLA